MQVNPYSMSFQEETDLFGKLQKFEMLATSLRFINLGIRNASI